MRFDGNGGGCPVYQPNSFGGPVDDLSVKEPPLKIAGDADRYDHRVGNDDTTQAGDLYRLMGSAAQARLVDAIAGSMKDVPRAIQVRQVRHFYQADPAYGRGVAAALGIDPAEIAGAKAA
jgi:catalase